MANDGKFLNMTNGRRKQEAAIQASAGATDAGKIPALDSNGRFDNSMMPVGIGADTKSIITSEALAAGNFVNVYNNAGTLTSRKADATATGKEASGFVLAAVASGANALVYFEGTNNQLTGLTPGTRQYLSTTPGAATATPPSGPGNVVQLLGTSLTATEISFEAEDGDILA